MRRYRRARELAGLSLGQAARLLGIGIVDVIELESATDTPAIQTIPAQHVASMYGVSLAWLEGAEPVLPPVAQQLLRSMDSTTDRARVEELLGAIYTESKP